MAKQVATPAKWTELFGKAVREGVAVRQTCSGMWIATSGPDTRKAYVVSLGECECPGHEFHGYCKHRAMLAWTLGVLTLGAPEPPTPAAPPVAPSGRMTFGPSREEMVALRGQAARVHAEGRGPLVDAKTGEVLRPAA